MSVLEESMVSLRHDLRIARADAEEASKDKASVVKAVESQLSSAHALRRSRSTSSTINRHGGPLRADARDASG